MPTIGIYVPSIGINSGFGAGFGFPGRFRGVRADAGRLAVFSNLGQGVDAIRGLAGSEGL